MVLKMHLPSLDYLEKEGIVYLKQKMSLLLFSCNIGVLTPHC